MVFMIPPRNPKLRVEQKKERNVRRKPKNA